MNELARDLFSISYECPRPLPEVEKRLSVLVRSNPFVREYALHRLTCVSELFPPPHRTALRVLVRECLDDPSVRFFLRWFGCYQCYGEDGMSTVEVLNALAEEAPRFPYYREYMAQNAGARCVSDFSSHPEMIEDLPDYVDEEVVGNLQAYPGLLQTALAILISGEYKSWKKPKDLPSWEDLQGEFELAEFEKIEWKQPDAGSKAPVLDEEGCSCETALNLVQNTERAYDQGNLIREIARRFPACDCIRGFLREIVLGEGDWSAAAALDSLREIGAKKEARELAFHMLETKLNDPSAVCSARRVLENDQSDLTRAGLLRLAADPACSQIEWVIRVLAENHHDRPDVKQLVYDRARRRKGAPQSSAALIALFWFYGDKPEALSIFKETAKEASEYWIRGLALTCLDCLRCSSVSPLSESGKVF